MEIDQRADMHPIYGLPCRGNTGVGGRVGGEENGTYMPRGRVQDFVAVVPESLGCYGQMADAVVDGDPIMLVLSLD